MRNLIFIESAIIYIITIMLQCCTPNQELYSITNEKKLNQEYGLPNISNKILLKDDVTLYEYQGGLYKFIPDTDSLYVIENIYKNKHTTCAIWYIRINKDSIKILDHLTWNHDIVSF